MERVKYEYSFVVRYGIKSVVSLINYYLFHHVVILRPRLFLKKQLVEDDGKFHILSASF
jgi:hypothetical protein